MSDTPLSAKTVITTVACPDCLAPVGTQCLLGARFKTSPHRNRWQDARRALGLPPSRGERAARAPSRG